MPDIFDTLELPTKKRDVFDRIDIFDTIELPEEVTDIPLEDAEPALPPAPVFKPKADEVNSDEIGNLFSLYKNQEQIEKGLDETLAQNKYDERLFIARDENRRLLTDAEDALISKAPKHPLVREIRAQRNPVYEEGGLLFDTKTDTPLPVEDARVQQFLFERQNPGAIKSAAARFSGAVMGQMAGLVRNFAPSNIGADRAAEYLGQQAAAANATAQLNQETGAKLLQGVAGAGGLLLGNPANKLGIVTGALRADAEAEEGARAAGLSHEEAQWEGQKTMALLPAYMGGSLLAGRLGGALAKESGPIAQGVVGAGAATAGNIGISSALAAAQDHPYTVENLGADVAFGALGGFHQFQQAKGRIDGLKSDAVADVEGLMGKMTAPGEKPMPSVSSNVPLAASGLERPLSREEAFVAATQGLDAVRQRPAETGTLEAGYREAGDVATNEPQVRAEGENVDPLLLQKPTLDQIREQGTTPPDPNRRLGPGAANIEEFGPKHTIGTYNAAVDAQRVERGLQPLMSEGRKSNETTWDAAVTRIEADADLPRRVTDEILEGTRKAVSDEDQAILGWKMVDLRNKRNQAAERMLDESLTPEERAEHALEFQTLERDLQRVEEADRKFGTEWGRTGQFRQRLIADDYTLGPMMGRATVAKGEPLTEVEAQQVKAESQRIQEAEKASVERKAEVDEAQSMAAAKEAVREEAAPRYSERFVKWAENKLAEFDAQAESGHRTLMELFGRVSANPFQPKAVTALYHIAKAKVARAGYNLGKFTAEMVSRYGEPVKPFIKPAWDKVEKFFSNAPGAPKPPTAKEKAKQAAAAAEADGTEAGVAAVAESGAKTLKEFAPYIRKLGQEYSRAGMQVEAIEARLHEVFSPLIEGVTPRELRDTWSRYGQSKAATTDPAKVAQAQRQGEAQKLSALEDLQRKLGNLELEGAKLTGQQRVEPSDRYRRLQTEINDIKKKIDQKKTELGIKDETTEQQMKSALDTMEKRTENRIKDLRFEIAKGERILKQKGEQPTSPRLEALRKELAEVRAEHEAVFGKRQATPEQKLAQAIKAAERAEVDAQAELADARKGIFRKPEAKAAPAREVEAIRARIKAAKEETKLLKKLANPPLSDAQKALDAAMVARERWEQVLAGEIAPAKKMPREALTQLEEDARLEIEAMRKLAAEMRAKPRTTEEERTLKALEKATAEYERRLNDADFSARSGKKLGPDTPKVAQARAVRDAAKAAFDAARKAAGPPPKSKDEIAIQSYKTAQARRAADYTDRVAKGDFEPRKRKELDVSKDPEAVRLKAEADKAKEEFQKRRFEWEQAKRSRTKKVIDTAKDVLASTRTLITSGDVSAPFRQGGFLLLGDLAFNPVRAGKQIGKMFHVMASEKGFNEAEAALRLRPNAELYEQSGLHLSDPHGKFTQREENMRSNLAEEIKIPWLAKKTENIPGVRLLTNPGRIVKGSNRAYAGFLNRQRADAFDAFVDMLGGKNRVTPDEATFLAKAVNDLTGRSDLSSGKAIGVADWLAKYLFSPRFLLSRFKTIVGAPIIRDIGNPNISLKARGVVALQYAKFAAGLAALYGLAKLSGAEVEKDPRSSDFGKAKFGNTRIDAMAGLQQVAVFLSRMFSGKTKTAKGGIKSIRVSDDNAPKFGDRTAVDVAATFGRSKLAPLPAAGVDWLQGMTMDFERPTLLNTTTKLVVPIGYQDAPAIIREHGAAKGAVIEALNLLGMGVQHYEPRKR